MDKISFSRWRYWWRFHLPNVLYLLILLAVAAGSYWWIRKDNATAKPAKVAHPELADAFSSGMQINRTGKDGSVEYVVTAKEVTHYGDKNAELKDVTVDATPVGQPVSSAHADTAIWTDSTHVINLQKNVVLERKATKDDTPMTLKTEAMSIDLYTNLAKSDLPFVVDQGNNKVSGTGFQYDYGLKDLKMGGQPKDRIKAVLNNVRSVQNKGKP